MKINDGLYWLSDVSSFFSDKDRSCRKCESAVWLWSRHSISEWQLWIHKSILRILSKQTANLSEWCSWCGCIWPESSQWELRQKPKCDWCHWLSPAHSHPGRISAHLTKTFCWHDCFQTSWTHPVPWMTLPKKDETLLCFSTFGGISTDCDCVGTGWKSISPEKKKMF